jgi:hypothetical protein
VNGRILPFEGERHAQAQRLLPWLAVERLDDDQAWVRPHVAGCSECRRELEALRRLHAAFESSDDAVAANGSADDMAAAAHRGWRRIQQQLQPASVHRAPAWQAWRQPPRWLGWAFAGQAAALAIFGAALLERPPAPASYRTLGAVPASATGNLLVMFDPHLDEIGLRRLLIASQARIVDGPNATGAYVLSVPPSRLPMVRDALRAAPGVVLVATLAPEPAQ